MDAPYDIDIPPMTPVEREYLKRIFSMTGQERVMLACGMFDAVREMLRHQIRLESPGIDDHELKIRVAERMYSDEPEILRILNGMRKS